MAEKRKKNMEVTGVRIVKRSSRLAGAHKNAEVILGARRIHGRKAETDSSGTRSAGPSGDLRCASQETARARPGIHEGMEGESEASGT
jgi:hypothetical protein